MNVDTAELRQFAFGYEAKTHLATMTLSIPKGLPNGILLREACVQFSGVPPLTVFYAQSSEKVPESGWYIKITRREAILLKGFFSANELERYPLPPGYRVWPVSLTLTLSKVDTIKENNC